MSPRNEVRQILVSRTETALQQMLAIYQKKPSPELARRIEEKRRFLERIKR